MNLATAKLKDSMVRVKALIDYYNQSPKGIFDTINNVTIKDLETLLEALRDRRIVYPPLEFKTPSEITRDLMEAKEKEQHESNVSRGFDYGYKAGYKAGRDREAERVRELVNKFWGL